MTAKPSLAAALGVHERRPRTPINPTAEPPPAASATPADRRRPPSRRGKKVVNVHVEPEVSKQLRQIALDQDSSVQHVVLEALNDFFAKYQRPPIA